MFAIMRKPLKFAVSLLVLLFTVVIVYHIQYRPDQLKRTHFSDVEVEQRRNPEPPTQFVPRFGAPPDSDGALHWRPLPAEREIKFRMDLKDTKHVWPWGPDKYDTLKKCEEKKYDLARLSPASVIICFHQGEQLEHLLHTVHSVVQNSPPQLLHEVILVDDNSNLVLHDRYLRNYVAAVFKGKVRVVRHSGPGSLGVIGARLLGFRAATAPVILTLDAHMEARRGWLEPLLDAIARDRRTLASVTLDWMKPQKDGTWVYEHGPSDATAAWFWQLFAFSLWEQQSEENTRRLETDPTQPFLNPCTIGHWAMEKRFFYEIGSLDPGMQLWGGENIDLAIRTYLWDGRVLGIPCSHVAHLEDDNQRSYRYKEGLGKKTNNNYKRIVEVWLDDYKDTFYYYNPAVLDADAGNLTERMQLKARCPNTFQTFMDKGYPMLGDTFGRNIARGGLKCAAFSRHTMYWSNPWTYGMRSEMPLKENQEIFLTEDGFLQYDLAVYNAEKDEKSGEVKFSSHTTFKSPGKDSTWLHRKNGLMVSVEFSSSCMQCAEDKETIVMAACDSTSPNQQWHFNDYTQLYTQIEGGEATVLERSEYLKKYHKYLTI